MKDTYRTISTRSTGEFKDRGSKFLAYAFPVFSEAECRQHLEALRKLHPKARHYCYAFRLGSNGEHYRTNDDGEPSGTAGRPILGQIDSLGLTNVLVIVVRYFGGTLLGTSGLIQAYKLSASDALAFAEIIERTVENVYRLTLDYTLLGNVMNAIKKLQLEILQQDFGDTAALEIAIRQSEAAATLRQLKALVGDLPLEVVTDSTVIAGLSLVYRGVKI